MEAKELRIGNLVKVFDYKPKVEFDTIATITQYGWETVNGYNGIEPIPLTEEWLLKFGFEINRHFARLNNFELGFITREKNWQLEYSIGTIGKWILKDIEYVHQLQNLYFALTGEELELK